MNIYTVEFDCIYPVGCCLVIAAVDINQAKKIAKETIMHDTEEIIVEKVDISTPGVIEYSSGEY